MIGADNALFATSITTGSRIPETICNTSCIKANPWEAVAVKVLTPVACEPIAAEIAECSDSTWIISASSSPSLINSASLSTMWVCGVIGYIGITLGLLNLTPTAAAVLASIIFLILFIPYFFSLTISIALTGHLSAHIPHPLQ